MVKASASHINKATCPVCDRRSVEAYLPFCSKRCADVDLHRWLSGAYSVPAVDDDLYDEDQRDLDS